MSKDFSDQKQDGAHLSRRNLIGKVGAVSAAVTIVPRHVIEWPPLHLAFSNAFTLF